MRLVATDLVKQHPGVLALDHVSVTFSSGEIHAIVGENGAGKSTLMKVLSGASAPDSGTMELDGLTLRFTSPQLARRRGIRMIHQELSLVPRLTVAENIWLGAEPSTFGVVRRKEQRALAVALLARLGQLHVDPDTPAGDLSLATQQMVEIAKALAGTAELLILDEPTAILSQREVESLFAVLERLRSDGVAMAYISHRMDEVFRLSDRITVLRDGRVVSTGLTTAANRPDVVRQMVGRALTEGFSEPTGTLGGEALRVRNLRSGIARNVSFTVGRGEIVALVGLVGSGRTEVMRAIFGAAPIESGEIHRSGNPFRPDTPRDAIAAGVALLPEDRKGQGLVLMDTLRANMTMATIGQFARRGVINRKAERAAVEKWIGELAIRTASPEQAANSLSGGNQQKVVLARWMLANATLLMFDEPTRGVDVGAKAEIYALMRRLTKSGSSILMVSSDLPEALGLADRVVVMRDGHTVGELDRAFANPDAVAALVLGEVRAA